jgi:hypothetical protein
MKTICLILLSCSFAWSQGIGGKSGIGGNGGIGGGASSVTTLYYGYGCNGTSTNTCTVGGSSATIGSTTQDGNAITTGSDASGYTVNACGIDISASAGNMQCAIYASGATGSPIANCTATAAVPTTTGWVEDTNFTSCTLSASTTYYVIYQASSNSQTRLYDSGGTQYNHTGTTFGTFPSNVTWNTQSFTTSFYIRVTAN